VTVADCAADRTADARATLADAVTLLFVPGDRQERFASAAASGADIVIIDLEDAVGSAHKDAARANAVEALRSGIAPGAERVPPFLVRINTTDPALRRADLDALASVPSSDRDPGFLGIAWPKLERADALDRIVEALGAEVVVLGIVESAVGVRAIDDVSVHPALARLAVGAIDLAADLRLRDARPDRDGLVSAVDGPVIEHCKVLITMASRLADLPAPVDSPSIELRDADSITATTARGAALGFGGRLCIHPAQVPVVAAAFAPTHDELDWAERVVEAAAAGRGGAISLDGRMIDEPVIERARQTLARRPEAVGA
jgi:citrate lyase subunit beta/citryl-CoA lyase